MRYIDMLTYTSSRYNCYISIPSEYFSYWRKSTKISYGYYKILSLSSRCSYLCSQGLRTWYKFAKVILNRYLVRISPKSGWETKFIDVLIYYSSAITYIKVESNKTFWTLIFFLVKKFTTHHSITKSLISMMATLNYCYSFKRVTGRYES